VRNTQKAWKTWKTTRRAMKVGHPHQQLDTVWNEYTIMISVIDFIIFNANISMCF
jgi:hypothetical protein